MCRDVAALEQETDPVRKVKIIEDIRNESIATWRYFDVSGNPIFLSVGALQS
jgi:hypothetical protein